MVVDILCSTFCNRQEKLQKGRVFFGHNFIAHRYEAKKALNPFYCTKNEPSPPRRFLGLPLCVSKTQTQNISSTFMQYVL